jgi:hypothetical protein
MSRIKVLKIVHNEFGELKLVLFDTHHDALGELIAAVPGRMRSIGQNLRGVDAGGFMQRTGETLLSGTRTM